MRAGWARELFVISDLHVGGAYPVAPAGGRGFRSLTRTEALAAFIAEIGARPAPVELVINGDFVDFLAEEHDGDPRWRPFVADPAQAAATFVRLAERDRPVFAALGDLLRRGQRLTLVLGNHDLELCLPAVRAELDRALGASGGAYRFVYDGEAYAAGDAVIEHGNRYDPFNAVDHDALRRLRSLQSRRAEPEGGEFAPPAGSRMVAAVMNPLKQQFPFIDLLKPESEPLLALLLALDPGLRLRLPALLWSLRATPIRRAVGDGTSLPGTGAAGAPAASDGERQLRLALDRCLGSGAAAFLAGLEPEVASRGADAPRRTLAPALALLRLMLSGGRDGWERRVGLVQQALAALDDDRSFDRGLETGRRYREAAERLAAPVDGRPAHSHVIFGHTHQAKELRLASGATYLNTGTWADLMRFPPALLDPDPPRARAALDGFLADIEAGRLGAYVEFRPSYVHLRIDADGRARGELSDYDWRRGRLA